MTMLSLVCKPRHHWALATAFLAITLFATETSAERPALAGSSPSQKEYGIQRDETWIQSQILRFRTYPLLDHAYRLIQSGKLQEAKVELERYLETNPKDLTVRITYAGLLYQLKEYRESIRAAEVVLGEQPGSADLLIYRGLAHQALDELDSAAAGFQAVADAKEADEKTRLFAWDQLADVSLRKGNYSAALAALDSLAKSRKDFGLYFRQGTALGQLRRHEEAEAAYRQAVSMALDKGQRIMALRALGENAKSRSDSEGARKYFQAALELDPKNPDLLRGLAQIDYIAGDKAGAVRRTKALLAIAPNSKDREFLANLLVENKDYAAAAAEYKQLLAEPLSTDERHRINMALGYSYGALGQHAQSVDAFRAARRIKDDSVTRMALVQALENAGQEKKAIQQLEKMAAEQPSADIRTRLGQLYAKQGDERRAAEQFRAASQTLPRSASEERHRLYMMQGYSEIKLKRHKEALDAFHEAAKIKRDAPTLMALAQALQSTGQRDAAAQALQEALRAPMGKDLKGSAYRQMGYLNFELGRYRDAQKAFQDALVLTPGDASLYAALGETFLAIGQYSNAATNFQRSLSLRETPQSLRGLALAELGSGNLEKAAEINRRVLAQQGLSAAQRGELQENQGFIYEKLGRPEQAAEAFRQAIETGRDETLMRLSLGATLAKMKRSEDALEQFQIALKRERKAKTLIYVGRAYEELRKPTLALDYLKQALELQDQLTQEERKKLYDELGYLYAEQHEYALAADNWKQSLALQEDSSIALRLGRIQRLQGSTNLARKTLDGIAPFTLTADLQAERFEELALIYAAERDFEKAIEAETQADKLASTPLRQYQLGQFYRDAGRVEGSIPHYEIAAERDPNNSEYTLALGYAYNQVGRYDKAGRAFEAAVQRDPDKVSLYKELAYLNLREGNNDQAVHWFSRAIDKESQQLADPTKEQERKLDIYRMRQEVGRIEDNFNFTIYQSYRSNSGNFSTTPSVVIGGVIPSQGGIELAYRPPVIGLRDERIFQVFSRFLWSNRPQSLVVDGDSMQGGIGIRYKPLKTQNLYLSAERLYKIGNNATNHWLLRATGGWDYGAALKPDKSYWNYTFIYGDLGYFFESPSALAYYGELRQGLTFKLGDNVLLTPHLVLDGRIQTPDPSRISFLEGGGGLSLKYLFNESTYESYRSSVELLLHYKGELVNAGSGFMVTGVFGY